MDPRTTLFMYLHPHHHANVMCTDYGGRISLHPHATAQQPAAPSCIWSFSQLDLKVICDQRTILTCPTFTILYHRRGATIKFIYIVVVVFPSALIRCITLYVSTSYSAWLVDLRLLTRADSTGSRRPPGGTSLQSEDTTRASEIHLIKRSKNK